MYRMQSEDGRRKIGPGNRQPAQAPAPPARPPRRATRCSPSDSPTLLRPTACTRPKKHCTAADSIAAWRRARTTYETALATSATRARHVRLIVPQEPALPGRLIDQEHRHHQRGRQEPLLRPRRVRQGGTRIGRGLPGGRARLFGQTTASRARFCLDRRSNGLLRVSKGIP